MDKVIIDNVNVKECKKYHNGWCLLSKTSYGNVTEFCAENVNCYYKQLKRLQAEYDDLHLSYAGCKTANTGLQELNKNLEEENKILNNMLKVNDSTKYDYYKFIKENERLKEENEKLNNQYCFSTILKINELEQENERLKEESKEKAVITKAYNDLVIEIISNIPYAGEIRPDNITPLDVLRNIKKERKAHIQALQEIRAIAEKMYNTNDEDVERDFYIKLQDKINEVIGAE